MKMLLLVPFLVRINLVEIQVLYYIMYGCKLILQGFILARSSAINSNPFDPMVAADHLGDDYSLRLFILAKLYFEAANNLLSSLSNLPHGPPGPPGPQGEHIKALIKV